MEHERQDVTKSLFSSPRRRVNSAPRVESRPNLLPFPTRGREGQRNLESGPVVSAMSKPKQTGRDQPTGELLDQARSGDEAARQRLMERFLPLLQRWARGRLPLFARATAETDDLVQVTLLRALQNVARFENRGEGAFLAYLRQILLNAVRDEVRRVGRRPPHDPIDRELPDSSPSAVERVIGRQAMVAYESALALLEPRQREAVLLRVEFGYSYLQIAESIASPTANGARMTVSRALARMAREMDG